jgi:hypothetical protein
MNTRSSGRRIIKLTLPHLHQHQSCTHNATTLITLPIESFSTIADNIVSNTIAASPAADSNNILVSETMASRCNAN